MSSPTVSVLMAVYNTERYVAQAVESILSQSWSDFELIIIDDGSTDRSPKILRSYAAKDARIRLVSRAHQGIPKTRNQLLSYARGEFVAIMDSDDIAPVDRLMRQITFLRQHPEVVCVGGAQEWIDEAGRVLICQQEAEEDAEIQQQMLSGRTAINHPAATMRRDAVMQVGAYDEGMAQAEDLDLFLRLGEVGALANLREPVVQYRQHSRSISGSKQLEQVAFRREACERAWQRRGIAGEFTAIGVWRPIDRPSRYAHFTRYGWTFFNQGARRAAVEYGLRSVITLPWAIEGWKLLVCALIKPLPTVKPS